MRTVSVFAAATISTLLTVSSEAATGPAGLPLPLYCSGSEPFWGLTIRDAEIAAYTWDNQRTHWHIQSIGTAAMRPTTWRVTFKGEGRHALIFKESNGCSDTDTDTPPEYSLLLEDGDALLQGCCSAGE